MIKGANGDDAQPQILLTNSHDGKAAFNFRVGIFRLVCSNGLVISDADFGVMSILDATYWLIPDQMMQAASAGGGGGAMAGTEEYDPETTPPTVKARAAFFPVLIHEMIKGTYELMGSRGFTGSAEQAELVMSETDSLVNES